MLIGSISLGLIQLIVVGLDIADNLDWLAAAAGAGAGAAGLARQWPILLPLLQFCFVSLLMQFILAQVSARETMAAPRSAAINRRTAERRVAKTH